MIEVYASQAYQDKHDLQTDMQWLYNKIPKYLFPSNGKPCKKCQRMSKKVSMVLESQQSIFWIFIYSRNNFETNLKFFMWNCYNIITRYADVHAKGQSETV